ncbi:hypothetical protein [Mycobacterium sp. NPDC004974]
MSDVVTVSNEDLQWSRGGLGNGGGLGGRRQQPASTPKPDTTTAPAADAPKPDTDSTKTTDADAKTGDTKTPDTKPDPKRFSPPVGKAMTQLGVPPSAVRAIKAGEPIKGIRGLAKGQWGAGQHLAGKLGDRATAKLADKGLQGLGKGGIKVAARLLPGVGSVYAGYAAFKDFKSGDYVGAALNAFGVIPGPVGWVALGLSLGWDALGFGDRYEEWQAPDGTNTFMLMRDAKDVAGVKDIDQQITQAQRGVFSFEDGPNGSVWDATPPAPLTLSTQEVVAAATDWINGISEHFETMDKLMLQIGEQAFNEQRQPLVPHLTAMAKLKTQVKDLTDQLTAADKGAAAGYKAVTDANRAARGQLANSGKLEDQGPATTMRTELEKAQAQITAANSKIEQLWAETPPAIVAVRGGAPTGTRTAPQEAKPATVAPVTATPAAQTPAVQTPTKTETPTKQNDDLSKLLSQLGNKAQTPTTPVSNPLGNSGLGGGSPLGTGTGGGTGGGTPLSSSKPDTTEKKDEGKKLDDRKLGGRKTEEPKKLDDKSLSTPKPEQAKAAVPAEAKPAAAVPAPGTTAATAPTPAQQNAAHAAQTAEPSKEVDVKGQKTVFPDAKTAKLAEILSKADPTHPVSLGDAAKAAGLTPPVPGQDPGKQVAPAEAKPGDIMVAGDKSYMLLCEGKFYDLAEYKLVGVDELPRDMGGRAGYFHLADPNPDAQPGEQASAAPAPAQPQGPVSPQATNGVQHPVPNATGAPAGPTDTSQGTQQPAAPSGVPSTGTPGVPKPAAPGAGPANAAATDTGTGTGGPTTGGGALDPGAVK